MVFQASLVAQMVKNLPPMKEAQVQSLGWEDPLEKGMGTQSSNLAWEIPWTEESVGHSPWGRRESDMTEQLTSISWFQSPGSSTKPPEDFR